MTFDPQEQGCVDPLEPDELQEAVTVANREAQRAKTGKLDSLLP